MLLVQSRKLREFMTPHKEQTVEQAGTLVSGHSATPAIITLENGQQPVLALQCTSKEEVQPLQSDTRCEIGMLRYFVWKAEGSLCTDRMQHSMFLDILDDAESTRHWCIRDPDGNIVAAARLTWHPTLEDDHHHALMWKRAGVHLPLPTCDFSRLVVLKSHRRQGFAQALHRLRIDAARKMGAQSIMVTASAANVSQLIKFGFKEIGETIVFPDRPNTKAHAMMLITSVSQINVSTNNKGATCENDH